MKKTLKNNKGSSLVEILVSILILALVLVGGIALYFRAHELMTMAVHKRMATHMASTKLEEIKMLDYADLRLKDGTEEEAESKVGQFTAKSKINYKLIDVDENSIPIPEYAQVRVNVFWTEVGKNSQSEITFVSNIAP